MSLIILLLAIPALFVIAVIGEVVGEIQNAKISRKNNRAQLVEMEVEEYFQNRASI